MNRYPHHEGVSGSCGALRLCLEMLVRRLTDGPLPATLEPLDGAFETRLFLFFRGFPRLAIRHDKQRNHEIVVIRNDAHLAKGHIARLPGEPGPGRYRVPSRSSTLRVGLDASDPSGIGMVCLPKRKEVPVFKARRYRRMRMRSLSTDLSPSLSTGDVYRQAANGRPAVQARRWLTPAMNFAHRPPAGFLHSDQRKGRKSPGFGRYAPMTVQQEEFDAIPEKAAKRGTRHPQAFVRGRVRNSWLLAVD